MTFDYYISDIYQVSSVDISTPYIAPNDLSMKAKALYRAYQVVPEQVSYNGYSTLSYTLEGNYHSFSLNADQRSILDKLQQSLNNLYNGSGSSGDNPETLAMASGDKKKGDHPDSFKEMTVQEVKKWLKEQGYKRIKFLGNRRFSVTRIEKRTGQKNLFFNSVFNANTGMMEPGFHVAKNGTTIFKLKGKNKKWKNKAHLKSRMKRKIGGQVEYILMDIIRNKKN